jgi:subtilisin family serine protease
MPSKNSLLIVFVTLAAAVWAAGEPSATAAAQARPRFRDDRILIVPKPGQEARLETFHRGERARLQRRLRAPGNIHLVEVPPGADIPRLLDRYRRSGLVADAQPDRLYYPTASPNDPAFLSGLLWHLNNTGQSGGVPDADLDAPEAWDTLRAATNIIVAVVDTGIHTTHQDLAPNLWVNPGEIPGNGVDDDGNGYTDDVHGINAIDGTGSGADQRNHGTFVAGVLAAAGNNGVGACGVAWGVRIMNCKFIGASNGSEADLIDCLDYARLHGAKVINCSFASDDFSPTLATAYQELRNHGVLVAAAAGNTDLFFNPDNDAVPIYPASFDFDNIVAVAATTRTDALASFSHYGLTSVDLAAPGQSLYSTFSSGNASYGTGSGTSFASPCVAAALALLRARLPHWTPQQIIQQMYATVDPLPALAGRCVTGGRLNLARALQAADYRAQPAPFAWVPTNGMTPLVMTDDEVEGPHALPFAFHYYGAPQSEIYIGANGLLGFSPVGLFLASNEPLPQMDPPMHALYPHWDDLNPALGGRVWMGGYGAPPARKFVVTWADVPHKITTGGQTRLTFQAILHETGEIAFQYEQVQSGHAQRIQGKSATVGIENNDGSLAAPYSHNGVPELLTNGQAILFAPVEVARLAPVVSVAGGAGTTNLQLSVVAQPGRECVVEKSSALPAWSALRTNTIPASGAGSMADDGAAPHRIYRAVVR